MGRLRWLMESMVAYWIFLLAVSLGLAAGIYEMWLKGKM
jgi:hypothetical protein